MANYKYEPLKDYLQKSHKPVIELGFDEINKILDSILPPCLSGKGYHKKLLWNNSIGNYATRSWLETGYVFKSYNIENRSVVFVKNEMEAKKYLEKI